MDNSCIIAEFHLDKLSVSAAISFQGAFQRCLSSQFGKKSHISKRCPTTKSVFQWQLKLVKDGTMRIQGLRLHARFPNLAVLTQLLVYL